LKKKVDDHLTRSEEFDLIRQAVTTLKNEFSLKFSSLGENNLFIIATYLDPRYKHKFFTLVAEEKIKVDILMMANTENDNDNANTERAKRMKMTDFMERDDMEQPGTSSFGQKAMLKKRPCYARVVK
jgi:hypothetical protein